MSIKKTVAIAAAAGALAAISVPAMAIENEFHGLFNLKWYMGNYEQGGSGYITPQSAVVGSVSAITGTASIASRASAASYVSNPYANKKLNNFFEQRARLQYIAKASDDLRLVTQFELDSVWGDRAQGGQLASPGVATSTYTGAYRNSGGAMESDAVNLETKHVYLDFKIPSTPTRVTTGIQPVKDAFKGILFDVDIAGINTVTKVGGATIGVGYFRGYDQSYFGTGRPRGADTMQIGALTADVAVSKDIKVGMAYYLYADNRNAYDTSLNAGGVFANPNLTTDQLFASTTTRNTLNLHTLGLNFDAKMGSLGLSGFAAMQQGMIKGTNATTTAPWVNGGRTALNGYAFNLAAKAAAGPGTFRTAYLFTTGDDGRDGVNTAWQGVSYSDNAPATIGGTASGGNTYNEGGMFLLNRNALQSGGSNDMSLVYSSNNKNQGVHLYTLGYDAKLGAKAYANANLGFAWASKDNASKALDFNRALGTGVYRSTQRNATNYMGSELNLETGYKMYDNLTVKFQAAYVLLGGYYTKSTVNECSNGGKTPADPYTVRTGLSYTF